MQRFWNGVRWMIQFGALVNIITLAWTLWFIERVLIRPVARRPRGGAGTSGRPIGADPVIRLWASQSTWSTTRIRRWLGRYVQSHHPRVHQRLRRLFG
jgi:hypothetical protein